MANATKTQQEITQTDSQVKRSGSQGTETKAPDAMASISDNASQATIRVAEQVKTTAKDAYESATAKVGEAFDEKKTYLTGGLTNVADNVRKFGDNLTEAEEVDGLSKIAAEYTNTAAEKIEQVANYLDGRDLNAMFRDVEDATRRNPAIILGGAFVLGFLATRFLKSSPSNDFSASVDRKTGKGNSRSASQPQTA